MPNRPSLQSFCSKVGIGNGANGTVLSSPYEGLQMRAMHQLSKDKRIVLNRDSKNSCQCKSRLPLWVLSLELSRISFSAHQLAEVLSIPTLVVDWHDQQTLVLFYHGVWRKICHAPTWKSHTLTSWNFEKMCLKIDMFHHCNTVCVYIYTYT